VAKLQITLNGKFDEICSAIEHGIVQGSITASLEERSDFSGPHARCSVRVFERFSHLGGNRLSLSVTLFQDGNGPVHMSAVTAGGSQAMFVKLNTFGETAFLRKLEELLVRSGYIK